MTDPRVQSWDLRGKIRKLVLEVQSQDGRLLRKSRVWIKDERGKGGSMKTTDEGRIEVYVSMRAAIYGVRSHEFGVATFSWDEAPGTIVRLEKK